MKKNKSIKISLTTAIILIVILIIVFIAITSVTFLIRSNKGNDQMASEVLTTNTTLKDERCCNIEDSLYKFNELKNQTTK